MPVNHEVKDIAKKVFDGGLLSANEISTLLKIEPHSVDAGCVMGSTDEINRKSSKGKAEVHAQIGLNLSPCPNNCLYVPLRLKTEYSIKEMNSVLKS